MAVESVLTTQKPVVMQFEDIKVAGRTRRDVYGLRTALMAAPDHPLHEDAPKVRTELVGTTLTISHADAIPGIVIQPLERKE
jgi:hypothetical protein